MRRLCSAALLLALLLAGCSAAETPALTPAPTPYIAVSPAPTPVLTPAPTPVPTPCPHPAHDAETRRCAVCGEKVPHSYADGVCTRCGEAPVFETVCVPRELFEPCSETGTVELLSYTTADYRSDDPERRIEKQMAVYLPCGYDPAEKYDLLILMHGIGGSERYWLLEAQDYYYPQGDYVYTVSLLDRMMAEAACRKMIIAAPSFYRCSDEPGDYMRTPDQAAFTRELREDIIPALVGQYSTYAAAPTPEAVAAAREHFAYAGLSMGSIYAYTSVIPDCLDLFAWFGCFSGSDGDMPRLAEALNEEPLRAYTICYFYNSIGTADSFYSLHWNQYHDLVWRADCLTDGENAAFTEFPGLDHVYAAWSLGLYNFLPLLFSDYDSPVR